MSQAVRYRAQPAALPPAGLPGLDPRWSRLVDIVDRDGATRTFHVLDSWAGGPVGTASNGTASNGTASNGTASNGTASNGTASNGTPSSEPVGTLLCLHGNPTWSYLWRRLLAAAPPGWRVVAPDQLGMGYSERIDRPRVLAQRVDDLSRLTDALGITGPGRDGPVVTVAHDWGGIISLGWAATHREQLRGVVLTNTAVHQPGPGKGPVLIRLAHQRYINQFVCRWTPLFVRVTTSLTWPRLSRDIRDAFAGPYDTMARRASVSDFVADVPFAQGHPSRQALDRIADGVADLVVPTLLLWGPRDPVFLEEHLRDLQDRLPQAVLHRYERASHLLPEDAPEYAAAVTAWMARLPSHHAAAMGNSPIDTSAASAADVPSALAELSARGRQHDAAVVEVGGRTISWAELASRVRTTAAGLSAAGVRPGDRVALLIPPSIELTVALYAVWQAGGVIVVVDKGLGLRGMGRALRSARIDHLIADTLGLLAAGPMRVPGSRIATRDVSSALRRAARVGHTMPQLAGIGAGLPCPAESGADDEAAVVFTSGATGPAKGVLYRHRQIRAQLALIRDSYRVGPDDRIVAAFAPFALYGPALGVPSAVPATDVTRPGTLTAAALGDAAAAIDATVIFASPAALANVLATAGGMTEAQRTALGQVRLLMSAGAPVPAELLRRLGALLPNADMHTPYGMTEGLPLTDISLAGIEEAGVGDGVCVGRPLPGVELLIAPLDQSGVPGAELTADPRVSGEIWVRAAHLKDRYDTLWMLEQASAAHPGWHRTGDVGALDEAGRLWVQGRTVHVLSTPTGPVTPVGIEQRVQSRLGKGDLPNGAGFRGTSGTDSVGSDSVGTDNVGTEIIDKDNSDADHRGGATSVGAGSPGDGGRGGRSRVAVVGRPGVAVVGVGPVGTQQVVVVLEGTGGPLAPLAVADAARAAAGREVAAVLVMKALPVDIRHNSKIDRVAVAKWADAQLSGRRSRAAAGPS